MSKHVILVECDKRTSYPRDGKLYWSGRTINFDDTPMPLLFKRDQNEVKRYETLEEALQAAKEAETKYPFVVSAGVESI